MCSGTEASSTGSSGSCGSVRCSWGSMAGKRSSVLRGLSLGKGAKLRSWRLTEGMDEGQGWGMLGCAGELRGARTSELKRDGGSATGWLQFT